MTELHTNRPILTIAQAAARLNISARTLHRMRTAGEIGFTTVGTGTRRPRIRFSEQHLEDWLLRAETLPSSLPAARRASISR